MYAWNRLKHFGLGCSRITKTALLSNAARCLFCLNAAWILDFSHVRPGKSVSYACSCCIGTQALNWACSLPPRPYTRKVQPSHTLHDLYDKACAVARLLAVPQRRDEPLYGGPHVCLYVTSDLFPFAKKSFRGLLPPPSLENPASVVSTKPTKLLTFRICSQLAAVAVPPVSSNTSSRWSYAVLHQDRQYLVYRVQCAPSFLVVPS